MPDFFAVLLIFASAFILALSGALMPGPLLTVTISETIAKGFRAGPLIVAGHAVVELLLVTGIAFGLGALLSRNTVIGAIGLIGGLVLGLMGLLMARDSRSAAEKAVQALGGEPGEGGRPVCAGSWRCVLLGGVVSLSNPYWTIWWVTIGLTLLSKALAIGMLAVGAFYLGHILADLLWYTAVAFIISRKFSWLGAKAYRGLLLVCAVMLVILGVYFIVSSVKGIDQI
jgi:threonine/homoserine/homoserine lactone efflux protein